MKNLVASCISRTLEPSAMKLRICVILVGLVSLVACGGGDGGSVSPTSAGGRSSGSDSSGSSSSSGTTALLVSLGEVGHVGDEVVSFKLTIDSVALHSSAGDVSLLSTPRRVELSRFKAEPLLVNKAPQGKYRGIVIAVSNPEISFVDSQGVLHEHVAASLTSSTATNPSEFSLDSTPTAVNLNVFLSPGFVSNPVTVTPALNFTTSGGLTEGLVGRVTAVASNSFTINVGNATFTLAADFRTEFQGVPGLGGLTPGMTVEVDAVFDSGGIYRATKVNLENDLPSALVVEGLTLSVSLGQLQMLVREVHGPDGVIVPDVGGALTINANSSSQFHVSDGVDLTNLDFTPRFDALTVAVGQNVRVSALSASAITADQLKLAKQSLDGVPADITAGSVPDQYSFRLNLNAGSAFAKLTGQTSMLVTLQPSTQKFLYFGLENCVPCIAGGTVRVRGLLFFSGGQYRLVAEWLSVG